MLPRGPGSVAASRCRQGSARRGRTDDEPPDEKVDSIRVQQFLHDRGSAAASGCKIGQNRKTVADGETDAGCKLRGRRRIAFGREFEMLLKKEDEVKRRMGEISAGRIRSGTVTRPATSDERRHPGSQRPSKQ
jgi:hypothetical protein